MFTSMRWEETASFKAVSGVRTTSQTLWIAVVILVMAPLSMVAGCGETSEWIAEAVEAGNLQAVAMGGQAKETAANPLTTEADFKPLNPQRENPFVYIGLHKSEEGSAFTGSLSQISVQGFASAGERAAILSISGQTYTMRVGDIVSGIELIAINPPRVTLRTAGSEWTASMFDSPTTAPTEKGK